MSDVNGKEITMPQLAESLVQATIGKWLKQPGESFEAYEPICEVITDKVVAELPATEAGVMEQIIAQEGETVDVGAVICRVRTDAAGVPAGAEQADQPAAAQGNAPAQGSAGQDMSGRYSPAVQRLAFEHGIDLTRLKGSGLGGRITRKDVLAAVESGTPAAAGGAGAGGQTQRQAGVQTQRQAASSPGAQPAAASPAAASNPLQDAAQVPVRHSGLHLADSPRIPTIDVEEAGRGETFIDVTPIRHTIASRMRQSVSEIPHAWTMIEVDVTNLVLLRNKVKDEFMRKEGFNLTYLAFVLKAVVNAIKDYPIMNSVWAVDKIIVKRDINLSLAVGTEDSVLTPVIKHADQKNIAGLAREIDELARKTREGRLRPDDMQGGTFTVNNTGSFGSILSYPIINYPQAAILTFESIVKKPVVINDMIAVRSMANMCLSLDHRILDGVICGRFLQRVKENLEGYTLDTKVY
ncbi:2-oxo acid dehydrogenase subunit E2 [Paenibacillus thiaminolyticus]|uniref:Dihydrolipoamide acetyltransferase component of pyruvate dehydrogenase complex n=4 Tax=Paenibacillus thiaminolyticus TaxID=49283 RepID=A0AAP9IZZ7_PANTH|nr:dihydrolipoamide acetyltransferase family protein [Paenibacillus thiaminolyticus]MCY9536310.1 2-oxo acid dehydrogenase subunit E2 [Paenibacillus thiaminolyticus]MCY9601322.1 2-oxo acid dehydrogenase subunit E2 [Paenibacillus thiaminolyticus]MCY9609357.1 2-oxo acid dehydrogenase subunit E2 [Paenibacillus thiaminolyticus]MCY9612977.1 2-oxo acid dehydrogenase subunit E2 [Paenibacillus thiaminolyticus]MCY9617040.1 2-oxo acid dehydrogenase subunit E2 [Paenibacillus thiaminolyticus]